MLKKVKTHNTFTYTYIIQFYICLLLIKKYLKRHFFSLVLLHRKSLRFESQCDRTYEMRTEYDKCRGFFQWK